jgi:L-rhamnose-H+ transport protein
MRAQVATLLLLAASGFCQAAYALPVRHFQKWRWEQMWVAQSVTSNLLFPLAWAALVPASFWSDAARIPWSHWLFTYAWGLIWGLGGVGWGLSMTRLGLAFANSFVFGVTVLTGALLPLALDAVTPPPRPALFAAGLVLCVVSTALIGLFRRHGDQQPLLQMPFSLRSYPRTAALAVFAGLASAGYGLAFTFGYRAVGMLVENGTSPLSASLAIVLPAYLGAASVSIPLGLLTAKRTRTLRLLLGPSAAWNWSLAFVMGLFAAATAVLYGYTSTAAGHPSPNISFGVFVSFLVLGGVGLGLAAGEMRGSPAPARTGLLLSAGSLVAGAWLLNLR